MGVVRAGPPVARNIHELLLGYEMPAITALILFFSDLVIACFSETLKFQIHRISSKECEYPI
jgi:hypothetical protein